MSDWTVGAERVNQTESEETRGGQHMADICLNHHLLSMSRLHGSVCVLVWPELALESKI